MRVFVSLILIAFSSAAYGQQEVRPFVALAVDGSPVTLESYSSLAGVAVIFTGNECAFDNYYTSRIKGFADSYAGKIQFLLINAYSEPNESIEKMSAKYRQWGFTMPYLADKDQALMNIFGAKKSPEVFLLKSTGGKFFVVYQGALDDNPQVAADVKQSYLKASIDQLLSGQEIKVPVMRAVGCSIRRK